MEPKNHAQVVVGHSAIVSGPAIADKNHAELYIENFHIHGGNVYFNIGGSKTKTSKKQGVFEKISKFIKYPFRHKRRSYDLEEARKRSNLDGGSNVTLFSNQRGVMEHSDCENTTRKTVCGSQSEFECFDLNGESRSDEVQVIENNGDDIAGYACNDSEDTQVSHDQIDKAELTSSWIQDSMKNVSDEMQCRGEGLMMESCSDLTPTDSYETENSSINLELPYKSDRNPSKRRHRHRKFTNTHVKSPYERNSRLENYQLAVSPTTVTNGNKINRQSYTESLDSGVVCSYRDENGDNNRNNKTHRNKNHQKGIKLSLKRKSGRIKCRRSISLKNKLKKTVKAVVREFHFNERLQIDIYGLGSYFDRLNNGPPPSQQEQMRYEWLRLASFQHYTGAGNAINLARNGFYHQHTDGPLSTRCAYCDITHNTWEYLDHIETIHRQMSPDCTVGRNNPREYADTQIQRNGNQALSRSNIGCPVVISLRTQNGIAVFSSSVREIGRLFGNRVIQTADPESVRGEPDSRDHTDYVQDRALQYQHDPTVVTPNTRSDRTYSSYTADDQQTDVEEQDSARVDEHYDENNYNGGATCSVYHSVNDTSIDTNDTCTGIDMANETDDIFTATQPGINTDVSFTATATRESFQEAGILSSSNHTASTSTTTMTTSENGNQPNQQTDIYLTASDVNSPQDSIVEHATQTSVIPHRDSPPPVLDNVKHPEYQTMAERVNSFQGFPEYLDQTPEELALAGLYYVGTTTTLSVENEFLQEIPACKICMERPVNVNLLPCGHLVCCDMCASRLQICPICRIEIKGITKTRAQQSPDRAHPARSLPTLDNAKHPEYRTKANRVNSFQGFPEYLDQTPEQMALAGFYYMGEADFTRCFYCSGELQKWKRGDDPFVEHAKWFPSCGYIVDNTTRDRIRENLQLIENTNKTEASITSDRTISGASNKSGTKRSKKKKGKIIKKPSRAARANGGAGANGGARANGGAGANDGSGANGVAGANGGDDTTCYPEEAKKVLIENETLRATRTCKICMERLLNTTLLPCGHLVSCDVCATRLRDCPVCRKKIKGTVKTFMS